MIEMISESDQEYTNGYRISAWIEYPVRSYLCGAIRIEYFYNNVKRHECIFPPIEGYYLPYTELLKLAKDNAPKSVSELRKEIIEDLL